MKDSFGIEDAIVVRKNTPEFRVCEQQILKSIASRIEEANKDGLYFICSVEGVSDKIKNYLIKRGYKVATNDKYAKISWDE